MWWGRRDGFWCWGSYTRKSFTALVSMCWTREWNMFEGLNHLLDSHFFATGRRCYCSLYAFLIKTPQWLLHSLTHTHTRTHAGGSAAGERSYDWVHEGEEVDAELTTATETCPQHTGQMEFHAHTKQQRARGGSSLPDLPRPLLCVPSSRAGQKRPQKKLNIRNNKIIPIYTSRTRKAGVKCQGIWKHAWKS